MSEKDFIIVGQGLVGSILALTLEKRHKGISGLLRLFLDLKKLNANRIADLHSVLRTNILSFLFRVFFTKVSGIDKKRKERKALTRKANKIFKPKQENPIQIT